MIDPRSESWTRFHVLQINEDKENDGTDNVGVWSELQNLLDPGFTCIRRRDGSILIDVKTEKNSQKIAKLQQICNTNVSTSRDAETNSSTGTVLVPRSEFRNPEGLADRILNQARLQDLPASNAEYYTMKSSRSKKDLHFVKLTFETRTLPTYMYVGFERVKVKEVLPKPRQCQICWKFGHPSKYCHSNPCCPICGENNHNFDSCHYKGNKSYHGHCPNCNEDGHTAFSKKCPLYIREKEVLMIMKRRGISKRGALQILTESGLFKDISYAKRVKELPSLQQQSSISQQCQSLPQVQQRQIENQRHLQGEQQLQLTLDDSSNSLPDLEDDMNTSNVKEEISVTAETTVVANTVTPSDNRETSLSMDASER